MSKSKIKSVTVVNHLGDHGCPHCAIMFIDPINHELQAGIMSCKCCGKKYKVTPKIAAVANENKRKYDKACERVIKELAGA